MKKTILLVIAMLAAVCASAQYKVTSVDRQDGNGMSLLWIQELEDATVVYASLSKEETEKITWYRVDRKTGAFVDGVKYKLKHSVNMPITDEADEKWLRMPKEASKINFIMTFEKFKPKDGFEIIESDSNHGDRTLNFYGIHFEEVPAESFINAERFLDTYTVTTWGKYADNGKEFFYYIRDNVCVTCSAKNYGNDQMFVVDIVNDSDHGIKFDWNQVWIEGVKTKKDGTEEREAVKKYTPDSFESYLQQEDYYEAKNAVGGSMGDLGHLLKHESYTTDDQWAKLGFNTLASIVDKANENSIREYMANHPKSRPQAMKSQSIKAGEAYNGYVACPKKKKYSYFTIHMIMDGYDYEFNWR